MFLWRVSQYTNLTGLGGELSGGRWHTKSPGKRVLYVAEHPAVALIEHLANLGALPEFLPDHYQLLKIVAPDKIEIGELTVRQLASIDPESFPTTQAIGDRLLAAGKSAILRVPSSPSPESWNYLLNPLHPDASQIRIEWAKTVRYDRRLFHLSK